MPKWLSITVAFMVPALGVFIKDIASTHPMFLSVLNAVYAGFCGLAGYGANTVIKSSRRAGNGK